MQESYRRGRKQAEGRGRSMRKESRRHRQSRAVEAAGRHSFPALPSLHMSRETAVRPRQYMLLPHSCFALPCHSEPAAPVAVSPVAVACCRWLPPARRRLFTFIRVAERHADVMPTALLLSSAASWRRPKKRALTLRAMSVLVICRQCHGRHVRRYAITTVTPRPASPPPFNANGPTETTATASVVLVTTPSASRHNTSALWMHDEY